MTSSSSEEGDEGPPPLIPSVIGGPQVVPLQEVCGTDLSLSDQVSLLSSFLLVTETEPGKLLIPSSSSSCSSPFPPVSRLNEAEDASVGFGVRGDG